MYRYSPAALAGSQSELVQRARALAADCRRLEVEAIRCWEETYEFLKSINATDIADDFRADEVNFQVTLTLVYRVIPAPQGSTSQFCDECLEAARKAIRTHQQYTPLTDSRSIDMTQTDIGSQQQSSRITDRENYIKAGYVHWQGSSIHFFSTCFTDSV